MGRNSRTISAAATVKGLEMDIRKRARISFVRAGCFISLGFLACFKKKKKYKKKEKTANQIFITYECFMGINYKKHFVSVHHKMSCGFIIIVQNMEDTMVLSRCLQSFSDRPTYLN